MYLFIIKNFNLVILHVCPDFMENIEHTALPNAILRKRGQGFEETQKTHLNIYLNIKLLKQLFQIKSRNRKKLE